MQNGFGLMYIHRFINIPFLHMQRTYLLQALETNRQAFSNVSQQLDLAEENEEPICSYEKYFYKALLLLHLLLHQNNFNNSYNLMLYTLKCPSGAKLMSFTKVNISGKIRFCTFQEGNNEGAVKCSSGGVNRS